MERRDHRPAGGVEERQLGGAPLRRLFRSLALCDLLLRLLIQSRVLDGDGHLTGKGSQQRQLTSESSSARAVQEQDTQQLAFDHQWQTSNGLDGGLDDVWIGEARRSFAQVRAHSTILSDLINDRRLT